LETDTVFKETFLKKSGERKSYAYFEMDCHSRTASLGERCRAAASGVAATGACFNFADIANARVFQRHAARYPASGRAASA
jgi:hypothetical protein